MQLLKLHLSNINALKGEHTIDFTLPTFQHTGVFAITGNTGAGKTSILDAITLALYGQTPRKPEKAVITHGTTECMAALEFRINGKAYRSKWMLALNRNGEPRTPKMELAELPSETILSDHRITEAKKEIADLIGLSFDQFTKTVLLAQGDFAAFLDAKISDRSEILEKITGRTDYSDISKAAYERFKRAEADKMATEAQLTGFELLSEEEKDHLQSQIQQAQGHSTHLQHRIHQLEAEAQRLQTQKRLLIEQGNKQAQYEQCQAQQAEQIHDFERLAQHQRIAPYRHLIDRFQQLPPLLKKAQSEVTDATQALDNAQQNQQQARAKQQAAERELTAFLEAELPTRRQHIAQARELDRQRQTLQAQQEDHQKAAKRLRAEIDRLVKLLTDNQQEQAAAQQEQQAAQTFLSDHATDQILTQQLPDWLTQWNRLTQLDREISDGDARISRLQTQLATLQTEHSTIQEAHQAALQRLEKQQTQLLTFAPTLTRLDDYPAYHDALQQSLRDAEQLYSEWRDFTHWAQRSDEAQSQLQATQAEVHHLQQAVEQLASDVAAQEAQVAAARRTADDKAKIAQLEIKLASFEQHRQQLIEGEKCPLCFATHHPCHDAGYQPEVERSKAEQEAANAEQALERQRQHLSALQMQHATQSNALHRAKQQHQDAETRIQALHQEWQQFAITIQQWASSTPTPRLQAATTQAANSRENWHNLQALEKQLLQLRQAYDTAAQQVHSTSTRLEHVQQRLNDTDQQLTLQRQHHTERLNEQLAIRSTLLQQLSPLGIATISPDLGQVLKRRHDAFVAHQRQLKEAQTKLTLLQNNHQNYTQQHDQQQAAFAERQEAIAAKAQAITTIQAQLDNILLQLESADINTAERLLNQQEEALRLADQSAREVLNNAKTDTLNRQNQYDNAQRKADHLRTEEAQLQHELTTLAQSLQRASVAAMMEALLDPPQAIAIEQRQTALHNDLQQLQARLQDIQQELAAFAESPYSREQLDRVQQERTTLQEERDALIAQAAEYQTRLANDQNQQHRVSKLQALLQTQQQEYNTWKQLNDLIGSSNGQKFNQFAQGLTLKRLIIAANAHLQRLYDRYLLIPQDTDKGVDLAIKDRDLGGTKRAPSTLSGGERFIVSLALALGLSDLSGSRTRIDSLFIDEGFGTLDARHLETVLQVLDNLHQQGKTIGIISHVPALQERISTQIRVQSIGGGYSRIALQA